MLSSQMVPGEDSDDDAASVFESALHTLYGIHQPAHGQPGQVLTFRHVALKPLPFRIPDSAAGETKLMAQYQWDAGKLMAELIADQSVPAQHRHTIRSPDSAEQVDVPALPFDVRNLSTLELGAGTGLPSLVAAAMGARAVVTDFPSPTLIHNIKYNIDLARESQGRVAFVCQAVGLAWGQQSDERAALSCLSPCESLGEGGFQRILAADTLWLSSAHASQISSMRRTLARTRDARVLLVAGLHTGRGAVGRFLAAAARPGMLDPARRDSMTEGRDAESQKWEETPLVPDKEAYKGGIWMRDCDGNEQDWSAELPSGKHEDIDENARWTVVAVLAWSVCI